MRRNQTVSIDELGTLLQTQIRGDLKERHRSAFPSSTRPKVVSSNEQLFVDRFLPRQVLLIVQQAIRVFRSTNAEGFNDLLRFAEAVYLHLLPAESYYPVDIALRKGADAKPYRDHVVHPLVVYSLGRVIMGMHNGSGKQIRAQILQALPNLDVSKGALAFAGASEEVDWDEVLGKAWLLTALFHDTGYLVDSGQRLESRFFGALTGSYHEVTLQNRVLAECEQAYSGVPFEDALNRFFFYPAHAALSPANTTRGLNHGQVIALVLLAHYAQRKEDLSKNEQASLFLAARAMFDHDSLTKPERLDDLVKSGDLFLLFFCLIDLLAELRLIWGPTTPKSESDRTIWETLIWLPLDAIDISIDRGRLEVVFIRTQQPPMDTGGYDYERACGSRESGGAKEKWEQYKKILETLGILSEKAELVIDDCYRDPRPAVLAELESIMGGWPSRSPDRKRAAIKGVVYAMTRGGGFSSIPARYGSKTDFERAARGLFAQVALDRTVSLVKDEYPHVELQPVGRWS